MGVKMSDGENKVEVQVYFLKIKVRTEQNFLLINHAIHLPISQINIVSITM